MIYVAISNSESNQNANQPWGSVVPIEAEMRREREWVRVK